MYIPISTSISPRQQPPSRAKVTCPVYGDAVYIASPGQQDLVASCQWFHDVNGKKILEIFMGIFNIYII